MHILHKHEKYATMKRVKNVTKNKTIFIRILLAILLVLWMLFIYLLSADNGAESEIKSTAAAGWTVILTDWLDTFFHFRDPELVKFIFHASIRKVAHLFEYAVLSCLWLCFLRTFTQKKHLLIIPPALLSVLYAAFDEFHQTLVPGRSGQLSDVFVDATGAAIGIACVFLILHLHKNRTSKNRIV